MDDIRQFHLLTGRERTAPARSDDAIYQALWEAIVEHRLSPGARLPEDALARAFGVSRTTIRRVLQRLALEQLITLRSHRGARIARPGPPEARDVFEARILLEDALLSRVVQRAVASDFDELQRIADAEQTAERESAIRLSARFHSRLMSIAGNESLSNALSQLLSRTSLIIAVHGRGHTGCTRRHHELIELLRAGDAPAARQWMRAHLDEIVAELDFGTDDIKVPDFERLFGHHRQRETG